MSKIRFGSELPAFPCIDVLYVGPDEPAQVLHYHGISKREWLAGLALQGLVTADSGYTTVDGEPFRDVAAYAHAAVKLADALLEELAPEEEKEPAS